MSEELAKRVVVCVEWDWMEGMMTHTTAPGGLPRCDAGTPVRLDHEDAMMDLVAEHMVGCGCSELCDEYDGVPCPGITLPRPLPVLTDPATLGCLRELVRLAWDCPWAHTRRDVDGKWRLLAKDLVTAAFDSEAEALVVALECAAP